jgi:CRP/FNR family cyclic AMP-dependent transcriptional regulator
MDHLWIEAVGYGGTACTVASYSMRTIVPLRIVSITSSLFFISYGVLMQAWPIVCTEMVLLPLNVLRLIQIGRMNRQVAAAAIGNLSGRRTSCRQQLQKPYQLPRRRSSGPVRADGGR